jgi:hypothetical protein
MFEPKPFGDAEDKRQIATFANLQRRLDMAVGDVLWALNSSSSAASSSPSPSGPSSSHSSSDALIEPGLLSDSQLSDLTISLGRAMAGPHPAFRSAAERPRCAEQPVAQLSAMLWAFGVSGGKTDARKMMAMAAAQAPAFADGDGVAAAHVARVLWSCAATGLRKEADPFLQVFAGYEERHLETFELSHMADAFWACAKLYGRDASKHDSPIRPVLEALVAKVHLCAQPTTGHEKVAMCHILSAVNDMELSTGAPVRGLLAACTPYRPEPSPLRGASTAPMFATQRTRDVCQGVEVVFHTKNKYVRSSLAGRIRQDDKRAIKKKAREEGAADGRGTKAGRELIAQTSQEDAESWEQAAHGELQLFMAIHLRELSQKIPGVSAEARRDFSRRLRLFGMGAMAAVHAGQSGGGSGVVEQYTKSVEEIATELRPFFDDLAGWVAAVPSGGPDSDQDYYVTKLRHLAFQGQGFFNPDKGQTKQFLGIKPTTHALRNRALRLGLLNVKKVDYRDMNTDELKQLCSHYKLSKAVRSAMHLRPFHHFPILMLVWALLSVELGNGCCRLLST